MLFGGSSSLGDEGERATIDGEISKYTSVMHTHRP